MFNDFKMIQRSLCVMFTSHNIPLTWCPSRMVNNALMGKALQLVSAAHFFQFEHQRLELCCLCQGTLSRFGPVVIFFLDYLWTSQ